MTESGSFINRISITVCQGLIVALYLKAVSLVVFSHNPGGIVAQQIFMAIILVLRLKKGNALAFMPDEIVVSLPYLWAISVLLQVASPPVQLTLPSMVVFVLAIYYAASAKVGFSGGLKSNSLLQAVAVSVLFILAMSYFLLIMLPAFDLAMHRAVILNLYFSLMGIPVSLCAFSWLLRQNFPAADL